eukprot:CAMPEP_0118978738 /NCGR_PEP_ID=MMETSP1173-20130426/24398_1 /TAXON_ID=1034831 /ORGANISM="Rhizochromulina marina cf, Strain CCMP1243" /LENGTH=32 /DNA_ID= /DNA_START= /DNA_END= /DNA_ORIENTATION=
MERTKEGMLRREHQWTQAKDARRASWEATTGV